MSYGTIMIGKLKISGSGPTLVEAAKKWEERKVDGFQGSYSLLSDDGVTVVSCVTFESKEKYLALADNPGQDEWWRSSMAPHLDGDPQWIDGEWAEQLSPLPSIMKSSTWNDIVRTRHDWIGVSICSADQMRNWPVSLRASIRASQGVVRGS